MPTTLPNPFMFEQPDRFVLDELAFLEEVEAPSPQEFSPEDIGSILEAIHKIAA